ncbi:hypothetical protein OH77DRAFT_1111794 [Trametes cingulata]|nr:hypothetical protein OH77DRAFT_1111794 [Trametes cingulata]
MLTTDSSAFPTEIYERIIWHAYLQLDRNRFFGNILRKPSVASSFLCACALTCSTWLPISRICLYRKLTFTSETKQTTLDRLIATLDANHAFRELVVDILAVDFGLLEGEKPPPAVGWHSWPALLAGKVPRLRTLRLSFPGGPSMRHYCRRLLRGFTSVVDLTLEWDGLCTFSQVAAYLVPFPNISRLSLDGRYSHKVPFQGFAPLQVLHLPSVRHLHYRHLSGDDHLRRALRPLTGKATGTLTQVMWIRNPTSRSSSASYGSSVCGPGYGTKTRTN